MHKTVENLLKIYQKVKVKFETNNDITKLPNIIAVSKTFKIDHILPVINYGHLHYGENKVQEAEDKWSEKRKIEPNLKIHMVGKLQSNKARKAVKIFDYIHSMDNYKLADICKKSEEDFNRKLSYFIQVNIGNETQKSGVQSKDVKSFLSYCKDEIKLNVIGLMVLPPNDDNTEKHFRNVSQLNYELGLKDLSMGMSSDYKIAIKYKSTFLRIGSAILGPRTLKK